MRLSCFQRTLYKDSCTLGSRHRFDLEYGLAFFIMVLKKLSILMFLKRFFCFLSTLFFH